MSNEAICNELNQANVAPASARPAKTRMVDTGGTPPRGPSPQPQRPEPGLKGYDSGNPNSPNYSAEADEG